MDVAPVNALVRSVSFWSIRCMARHLLDPAFAKLHRVDDHICQLERDVRSFLDSQPYKLTTRLNRKQTEETWFVEVEPIPDKLECIAADAVHNVRTPLDKMLAAGFRHSAIHRAGATLGSIKFPTGNSKLNFDNVLRAQAQHLTDDVLAALEDVEPYQGGKGEVLYRVNQLDNRDKHRSLLTSIKLSMVASHLRRIAIFDGRLIRIGSRRGDYMVMRGGSGPDRKDLIAPSDASRPTFRMNLIETEEDPYLEFKAPPNDMDVLTVTPGSRVHVDLRPSLSVAFEDVGDFAGMPAVELLKQARLGVETLLTSFRKQFFDA